MITMRPSLLLLLISAIPFLSILLDPEKGRGTAGSKMGESRGLNRMKREMEADEQYKEEKASEEIYLNLQEGEGSLSK